MKRIVVLIGGALVFAGAVGFAGFWWFRSQQVVVSVPLARMAGLFQSEAVQLRTAAPIWPWDTPDLRLTWLDPWSGGDSLPSRALTGTPPAELVAYDVLGVLSRPGRDVPEGWTEWTGLLEASRAQGTPLSLSGRSDAELLTTLLWFLENRIGSPSLRESFASLAIDPAASLDVSGLLSVDHPWKAAVDEIRLWTKRGWITPQWLDYSDSDVLASVAEGRAAYGLGWLSLQRAASRDGVPMTAISPLPVASDRRSATTVGRWLVLSRTAGWGDAERSTLVQGSLAKTANPEGWLSEFGLLTAAQDLPAVDQESRRLNLQLLRSGEMVVAPVSSSDLARWHGLLEAVRTMLRP